MQPKITIASLTPALSTVYNVEALKPGQVSIFTDYSQGITLLRDSVTFSSLALSKQFNRTEVRIPYTVTVVDTSGKEVLDSRSYTKIVRDYSAKLTLNQRIAEFERVSSLFNKTLNPDFYSSWINGSPMLATS